MRRSSSARRDLAERGPDRAIRGRRRRSATPRSISSGGSCSRGTSRSSCSAISTAPCCRSSSASARSSGAIRRWSRNRRRSLVDAALRRSDGRRRRGGRARRRLHQRRHDRVPARRGRIVLLPRDEHAPAGRASGHRDGDRPRSRALADPHRARRAADDRSRARARRRAGTRSSAASTPRIPTRASCRRPAWCAASAPPSGPGIRDDGGVAAGLRRCRSSTTR